MKAPRASEFSHRVSHVVLRIDTAAVFAVWHAAAIPASALHPEA